jgi:hypothetical protein
VIDGNLAWVKSSYSGSQGGNCVEAAADGVGRVLVRDTKDRGGAMLEFRASRWREFSASLKVAMVSHLSNCPRSLKAGITPESPTTSRNLRRPAVGLRRFLFGYSSPTGGAGSDRTRRRRGPVA